MGKLRVLYYYNYFRHWLKLKSRDKLEKYQEKMLSKHLEYVRNNIPYYKDAQSLNELKVINKVDLIYNFNELNSMNISLKDAVDFALQGEKNREFKSKLEGISVGLSSGTSNSRCCFLVSEKEQDMWAGYVLAKLLPPNKGILHKHRIAFFMRANSNLYEAVGSKNIQFKFYDIYDTKCYDTLEEFKPTILVGQPSVLKTIAGHIEQGKYKISPEQVVSIAEVLEQADKKYIETVFEVPFIYQVYQCTEGCLGITDHNGNFVLNEDIVRIEKEYIDSNRFIPIITDFTRTTQPIIRYRLNDILVEKDSNTVFTQIEKIEGREDDVFIFKSRYMTEDIKVYPDFIRRCMMFSGDIRDYRVVQCGSNIDIYINADEQMKEKIHNEFKHLSNDMKFVLGEIQFKDYTEVKGKKLKRVERIDT